MKLLLINPWAVVNDKYYASGFINGMNKLLTVDFVCNFYYDGMAANGKTYPFFFKHSEKMKRSLLRKVIRGIEYIVAWERILKKIKSNEYDVIHIHWLLMYSVDYKYLKKIRGMKFSNKKMVLTAHNVLPHINGNDSIDDLRKIYSCFDTILVHGESIKKEFVEYFPEFGDRVKIQYHGEYYQQNTSGSLRKTKDYLELDARMKQFSRVYIMFGAHFYNKGTDRLVRIWKDKFSASQSLLLIMGIVDEGYYELQKEMSEVGRASNIVLINRFIEDDFLNYCISKSDCIVLPYRHASMSGIVYTAAAFKKPLICTRSGAIAEYLENEIDSIVCEPDDNSLSQTLLLVESKDILELERMGKMLSHNIHEKYSWDKITKDLYEQIYA